MQGVSPERGKGAMQTNRRSRSSVEPLEARTLLSQSFGISVKQQTIDEPGFSKSFVVMEVTITGPNLDASSFDDGDFVGEGPNGAQLVVYFEGRFAPSDPGPGHGYRIPEYAT